MRNQMANSLFDFEYRTNSHKNVVISEDIYTRYKYLLDMLRKFSCQNLWYIFDRSKDVYAQVLVPPPYPEEYLKL